MSAIEARDVCCPRVDQVVNGYAVRIACGDGSEAVDFYLERQVVALFGNLPAAVADAEVESVTLHACIEHPPTERV